jgi:hypothetical protein
MNYLLGFILLSARANAPDIQPASRDSTNFTRPALVEIPNVPGSLTLYNAKGERVAKCERKDEVFGDCEMEPGVSLDDLMNAWVHVYLDAQR